MEKQESRKKLQKLTWTRDWIQVELSDSTEDWEMPTYKKRRSDQSFFQQEKSSFSY